MLGGQVELSGALSNPRLRVELPRLLRIRRLDLGGTDRPLGSAEIGVRRTPIPTTVVHALKLADRETLTLREIHVACERILGVAVS